LLGTAGAMAAVGATVLLCATGGAILA
jgi:hypothetical protein